MKTANQLIKEHGFKTRPIKRNRDENGIILTYSVDFGTFQLEFNTLEKAKIMAIITEETKEVTK